MLKSVSLALVIVAGAACGDDDPSASPDAQVVTDAGLDAADPGDALAPGDAGLDLTQTQRVVVLADNAVTFKAVLYAFERTAAG